MNHIDFSDKSLIYPIYTHVECEKYTLLLAFIYYEIFLEILNSLSILMYLIKN